MEYFNDDAFAQIKKNLEDIPKDITSELNMKQILRELDVLLKQEMRRRVSYVK